MLEDISMLPLLLQHFGLVHTLHMMDIPASAVCEKGMFNAQRYWHALLASAAVYNHDTSHMMRIPASAVCGKNHGQQEKDFVLKAEAGLSHFLLLTPSWAY